MDRWTIFFAGALALTACGTPEPAKAPPPSAEAAHRLAEAAPPPPAAAAPKPHAKEIPPQHFACLALNVYYESRGEPVEGQLAVAYVTLNRVGQPGFAGSVCGVVHQSCQFGWTCTGRGKAPKDGPDWHEAQAVARMALAGAHDPTQGALYFLAAGPLPAWAARPAHRVVIGRHQFFRLAR